MNFQLYNANNMFFNIKPPFILPIRTTANKKYSAFKIYNKPATTPPAPATTPNNLLYHNGPIISNIIVNPIFWGASWKSSDPIITGISKFYKDFSGSTYAKASLNEYYQINPNKTQTKINANISVNPCYIDNTIAPSDFFSTTILINEIAKLINKPGFSKPNPLGNSYYPIYIDKPRPSNIDFCGWHGFGTINGIGVTFAFLFKYSTGDTGCGCNSFFPAKGPIGQSTVLAALANVSAHEICETMTDPKLNAWYDKKGDENSDKCGWLFNDTKRVNLKPGSIWKLQGQWSNNLANGDKTYPYPVFNTGCTCGE